ncbi:MAG: nicotinate-nucleotide--dimethylbenzimidazole phosphoribosyltransferase, partial [Proteobacteria bacterium]|nr:nicotinate-nucleotide--dimethylbenzimidazole phosphoribosyltransferase [Pseudomonadota bacterium]
MMNWIIEKAAKLNAESRNAALSRQGTLTKPPGSLGQLEEMAIWLAERQASDRPTVEE